MLLLFSRFTPTATQVTYIGCKAGGKRFVVKDSQRYAAALAGKTDHEAGEEGERVDDKGQWITLIYMEFNRIAGKNLKKEFYETLDRHSTCLLDIFRAKKGVAGQLLMNLLKQTKLSEPTEVRTLVLQGLPLVFGDDSPAFFKTCLMSDDRCVNLDMPVGIVIVEDGMTLQPLNSLHLSPSSFGIVIEGKVVMDNLHNLPESMCLLFGLIYALHLNYPKSLKYTFEFIQRIVLSMGQKDLQPKIQSLANQLFG